MSSYWLNIAFGEYHLQVGRYFPYVGFSKNLWWSEKGLKPEKWFRVYQIGTWYGN